MNSDDVHSTKLNAARVGEKLMGVRAGTTRCRNVPSLTPPQKSTKGRIQSPKTKSSTPSGSISSTPTHSFNLSPILNVSHASKISHEKIEPKILKPLGPQLYASERKCSTRSVESLPAYSKSLVMPDLRALYMMYQQQLYLNGKIEETRERTLSEGKKQLDELWTLMKAVEADTANIEAHTAIVENHTHLSKLVDVIKPVLKETNGIIENVAGDYQELTQALDSTRHKIHLTNIHPIDEASTSQWVQLMDRAASSSVDVQAIQAQQMVQGAALVSGLDDATKQEVTLLEECQRLSQVVLGRLGQELFLTEEDVAYRKLSEFDI